METVLLQINEVFIRKTDTCTVSNHLILEIRLKSETYESTHNVVYWPCYEILTTAKCDFILLVSLSLEWIVSQLSIIII